VHRSVNQFSDFERRCYFSD